MIANCLEQPYRSSSHHIGGIFGLIETHAHVTLRRQIVNFIRLHCIEHTPQASAVSDIAIMQHHFWLGIMRIHIEMFETPGVECRGSSDDAMDLIATIRKKLRKVRSILAGDPSDQGFFHFTASDTDSTYQL